MAFTAATVCARASRIIATTASNSAAGVLVTGAVCFAGSLRLAIGIPFAGDRTSIASPTQGRSANAGRWADRRFYTRISRVGSSWAHDDLATPGTFRLAPPPGRVPALRRDYHVMRDVYLTEPAGFDEVVTEMEKRINHPAGG